MQLFYHAELGGPQGLIGPDESAHLSKVMRARPGQHILLTNGLGRRVEVELASVNTTGCAYQVVTELQPFDAQRPTTSLAIAPTHHADRMEWLLEKAVEIGVGHIQLLQTARTERSRLRMDRAERIVLAAMKQSQRSWLPIISPEMRFADFITAHQSEQLLLAHCNDGAKKPLSECGKKGSMCWLLIGPEGDFTLDEVKLAVNHGATEVSLGLARLRTETAAIFGLSILNSI